MPVRIVERIDTQYRILLHDAAHEDMPVVKGLEFRGADACVDALPRADGSGAPHLPARFQAKRRGTVPQGEQMMGMFVNPKLSLEGEAKGFPKKAALRSKSSIGRQM